MQGRGASRGGRGAPFRGGRGGGPSVPQISSPEERKKREAILDLSKYVNERIRVKFTGGREGTIFVARSNTMIGRLTCDLAVTGILKGYDQLLNLVLDEVQEEIQGMSNTLQYLDLSKCQIVAEPEVHVRSLGLTVLRGPTITLLSPVDGLEEIANPFMAQE